jgi:branched-chain amino acid transport system ATP-binding protein
VLLKVEELTKSYGGLQAVDGMSFEVEKGSIIGLIGPNGAGKTTLFEVISGFQRPTSGYCYFKEERIDNLKPHQICFRGIGRTFQIPQIFPSFTVFETVLVAALLHLSIKKARDRTHDVLETVGLSEKAEEITENLTIPEQKRLEVGRALASNPELMLLDEVMSGLNVVESKEMIELIQRLQGQGLTFILVEHVMHIIMELCERIVVLNFGKKIAEGTPEEIANNEQVIEAYLGREGSTVA